MRPHQWAKSLFVLAPLVFTPSAFTAANLINMALAFVCFSAVASSVYILNDYKDREADRQHPRKKNRPLAARTVSTSSALVLFYCLLTVSFTVSFIALPISWFWLLLTYFAINIFYCLGAKNWPLVDVGIIASGFVLRVVGGCFVLQVVPSAWILITTLFLVLFLAFGKRRDDLVQKYKARKSLKGYNEPFVNAAMLVLGTCSILTYTLWTLDDEVILRLDAPYLYATTPFVVMGFLRYLQICFVEEKGGQPTETALTDKPLVTILFLWLCTFAVLVYI